MMKKKLYLSLYICLNIFSGLSIIGIIFSIALVAIYTSPQFTTAGLVAVSVLGNITLWSSIIGTFVSSIILLINKDKIQVQEKINSKYFIATFITSIVTSSVSFLFAIISIATPVASIFLLLGFIGIIVVFGLSVPCTIRINKFFKDNEKANEAQNQNNNNNI